MPHAKPRGRRRPGRADAGAAWISYSDMMAALLLVFVLVLCYSLYQYFTMLETKTAELDAKGQQLTVQSQRLDEQALQLDEQALQLQTQQAAIDTQTALLGQKQADLDNALAAIQEQQGILDTQDLTLEQQAALILQAQADLAQKEQDLAAARLELATSQVQLAAAYALQTREATEMSDQQVKLDNLVGVRTEIIQDLSAALAQANLKASVDPATGDIVLESAVFFDVGKSTIKDSGQELLNSFIPVYLSVLLKPEYADYLGEIIIEGHTDTQGDYLRNLKLSQDRALSVATFCLEMPQLSAEQLHQLRGILTAKGRSFSSPVFQEDGVTVDMDASRRVEFKFRLKDSEMIDEMRQILAN